MLIGVLKAFSTGTFSVGSWLSVRKSKTPRFRKKESWFTFCLQYDWNFDPFPCIFLNGVQTWNAKKSFFLQLPTVSVVFYFNLRMILPFLNKFNSSYLDAARFLWQFGQTHSGCFLRAGTPDVVDISYQKSIHE